MLSATILLGTLTLVMLHTCHKLWTKICEISQNFMGDLTEFCETFLSITLEFPQHRQKSLFECKKLVRTTQVCDLCFISS